MTATSLDDDLVYMLRNSHLSPSSLRDLEREIADRELLKNARRQHQLIQDAAITASINYALEEEHRKLEELAKQERRRVKLAEQRIKELAELERLKAVPTPTPPPPPPPPPPQPPAAVQVPKETTKSVATQTVQIQPDTSVPPPPSTSPPPQPPPPTTQPPPIKSNIFTPTTQPAPPQQRPPPIARVAPVQQQISTAHISPDAERYVQIHQELKRLRKHVVDVGKQNQQFRNNAGELRRALRAKIGQIKAIKGVPGANKDQVCNQYTLRKLLKLTCI